MIYTRYDWRDIFPDPDQKRFYYDPFQTICRELEKLGYEHIESEDRNAVLYQGFEKFLSENNIESNDPLYDFSYSEEPTE